MKQRSRLSAPHVITDTMPPTEQVDGRFYESKAEFRRVGRALGLTEVGNSKLPPKTFTPLRRDARDAIHKAVAEYKAGRRPKEPGAS
jgi:hypothetical protein